MFGGGTDGGNGVVEVRREREVARDEVESADQRLGAADMVRVEPGLVALGLSLALELSHGGSAPQRSLFFALFFVR